MANGINRTTLLGGLGADPELRIGQSGTAVLKLRVATTERMKARDGGWKEHTEWHGVVVFGKRAEALANLLSKGSKVYIEGNLRTSSWDKDGVKRYRTEIVANEIILCSDRASGGARASERESEAREPARTGGGGFEESDYGPAPGGGDDDSIPFARHEDWIR